jgi:hypothetical protein
VISVDRAPFRLLAALAWTMAWGLRTSVVRMLDALSMAEPNVAFWTSVVVSIAGAAGLVVSVAVLAESGFARFVVVTALAVFAAVLAPGVSTGDPASVVLLGVHLVAAVLVWRTSLAEKNDRSNLQGQSGTRIGVN